MGVSLKSLLAFRVGNAGCNCLGAGLARIALVCGAGAVVLRLGGAAAMATGVPQRGPRTRTVDCRRVRVAFSVCPLLWRARRAYRPLAGDRTLSVFLFPRAERYNSRALSLWLRYALDHSRN